MSEPRDGEGPDPGADPPIEQTEAVGYEVTGTKPPTFGTAVSWSYLLTGGRTVMTLIVSLVLARLLGPEIFGAIAMANVFVLFIEMFVRQGLVSAIVQRPNLTRIHLDTAFWLTVATVSVLAPLTIALSGWWADLNTLPELRWLIIGLTPGLVFKGLGVVQEAQIRRAMDFRPLALRTNVAVVVGGTVGITAAFLGAGVWALVTQQLITAFIELVMIWRLSPWRPRMRFDRACAVELMSFSGRTLLATLGGFINVRSDALLIGLFFGPIAVGLYRMAVRFIDLTLEVTAGALQAVFLPELSRSNQDQETFNQRTVEVVRIGALLAIPLLGALAAASDPLVLLLGQEWAPASDVLEVLCILAAVQAVALFIAPILQAAGRPGVLAWLTWISAALSAGSFTASGLLLAGYDVATQVLWIAIIRVAVFAPTLFVIVLPVLRRTLGLSSRRVLLAVAPAAVAALTGYLVTTWLQTLIDAPWVARPVTGLLFAGSVAVVIAVAVVMALDPHARALPALVKRKLAARRRSGESPTAESP